MVAVAVLRVGLVGAFVVRVVWVGPDRFWFWLTLFVGLRRLTFWVGWWFGLVGTWADFGFLGTWVMVGGLGWLVWAGGWVFVMWVGLAGLGGFGSCVCGGWG